MEQKSEKGIFKYKSSADRERAFTIAEAYFEKYPDQKKLRKKKWEHVLRDLRKTRPDLNITQDDYNLNRHSFFNVEIETVDESKPKKEVWVIGSEIAKGGFGRVKHTMNRLGEEYVYKIEGEKNDDQKRETSILRDLGILASDKFSRESNKGTKYYTGMVFLGIDLFDRNAAHELQDKTKLLSITRKAAWQLHLLHTGAASKTGKKYAHCDIKPENIMLANDGSVTITDYGIAKETHDKVARVGTIGYLPSSRDDAIDTETEERMRKLGLIGTDLVAFKKTFWRLFKNNSLLSSVSDNLRKMLGTSPIDKYIASQKKKPDTALKICMTCLEEEYGLKGELTALDEPRQELIGQTFAVLDKLEALYFGHVDEEDVRREVSQLRKAVIKERYITSNIQKVLNQAKDKYEFDSMKSKIVKRIDSLSLNDSAKSELKEKLLEASTVDELILLHEKINLITSLDTALKNSFYGDSQKAHDFFTNKFKYILSAEDKGALNVHMADISKVRENLNSAEMRDLNKKIKELETKAGKKYLFISSEEYQKKADLIKQAVYEVPIDELGSVLNNYDVQKALSYNRITNKHLNDKEKICESVASFKEFKSRYQDMRVAIKNSSAKVTSHSSDDSKGFDNRSPSLKGG